VLLVASSGGHLLELVRIASGIPAEERRWVTFDRSDTRTLLAGQQVTYAHHPTNRNVRNLVRNLALAARVVLRAPPRAVVTTGAGVAVPFCYAARLAGVHVIYVESLARVNELSLTGRLVRPVVNELLVQWPVLADRERKARFIGAVI